MGDGFYVVLHCVSVQCGQISSFLQLVKQVSAQCLVFPLLHFFKNEIKHRALSSQKQLLQLVLPELCENLVLWRYYYILKGKISPFQQPHNDNPNYQSCCSALCHSRESHACLQCLFLPDLTGHQRALTESVFSWPSLSKRNIKRSVICSGISATPSGSRIWRSMWMEEAIYNAL